MHNPEQGPGDQESSQEEKLEKAISLVLPLFQKLMDECKERLEGNKESVRKNLNSRDLSWIDKEEARLKMWKEYLKECQMGNFFDNVSNSESVYDYIKRVLEQIPGEIQELEEEKSDSDDLEIKRLTDMEIRELDQEAINMKMALEAIEATDFFQEFKMNEHPENN